MKNKAAITGATGMPALKTEAAVKTGGRTWVHALRVLAIWAAGIVGCLSFSSYIVVRWVERQILTTDNWITLVSPLPKQPVVSTALGSYIAGQVFENVPVEDRIRSALPPAADFLAPPLASQLQGLTTKAAQNLVASDAFQAVWTAANRAAMDRVVAVARGQTPPLQQRINERFDINLSGSLGKLRDALGKAADAFPALQPAADKSVQLSADLQARPRLVHTVIQKTDTLYKVLPFLTLAALLFALAFAWQRRKVLIAGTVTIFVLLLIELVGLKWLRQETLAQVHNADNVSAVSYIFDTLVSGLKARIYAALGIAAVVWALCLAAGPARWAVSFRSMIALDRLRRSRIGAWWRTVRTWIRSYLFYIWLAVFVLVLGYMVIFLSVSGYVVMNALLLVVGLCALTYIIATPHGASLRSFGME